LLYGDDRLPRQTDAIGEFLLGHLLVMKSQSADVVANARVRRSHGLDTHSIVDELRAQSNEFSESERAHNRIENVEVGCVRNG
jgi:hypothetical protein